VLSSEILFCSERVVRTAPKLEILERWRAAERIGATMVDLEAGRFPASLAAVVAVRAARTITVEHREKLLPMLPD